MLIKIDECNIINPEKITRVELKNSPAKNKHFELDECQETHVVRIWFCCDNFIDCHIQLDVFSALMSQYQAKMKK